MYRDHRKGPGGPPGGSTYPGGPQGLKCEGIQPKVGWGATSPRAHAPRVGETLKGGGAPLLGGQAPHPLAAAPLGDCIS